MSDLEKQQAWWEGQLSLIKELRSEMLSASGYRLELQNREQYVKRKLAEIAEQR